MFKQKTVKQFSIVAIVLSIIGLLISITATILLPDPNYSLSFIMGIVSWAILLWASIIGYKLCKSYTLYEDEYKKVGIRIYLIILAFILFFFVGLIAGLFISVALLSTLWALKSNYDDWEYQNTPYVPEDVNTENQSSQ